MWWSLFHFGVWKEVTRATWGVQRASEPWSHMKPNSLPIYLSSFQELLSLVVSNFQSSCTMSSLKSSTLSGSLSFVNHYSFIMTPAPQLLLHPLLFHSPSNSLIPQIYSSSISLQIRAGLPGISTKHGISGCCKSRHLLSY